VTDGAGNPATAIRAFSVDTTAPETAIDSGPLGSTPSTTQIFTFSSEAGAVFECRLDSGQDPEWHSCQSPKPYIELAPGAHSFEVRATDAAGNVDPSPAARLFAVVPPPTPDTTPPQTRLVSSPATRSRNRNPRFQFTSNDSAARYLCRLDSRPLTGCRSPRSYRGLRLGLHSFSVSAVDPAGNVDPSPAIKRWRILPRR
jgi:hypothetical protein